MTIESGARRVRGGLIEVSGRPNADGTRGPSFDVDDDEARAIRDGLVALVALLGPATREDGGSEEPCDECGGDGLQGLIDCHACGGSGRKQPKSSLLRVPDDWHMVTDRDGGVIAYNAGDATLVQYDPARRPTTATPEGEP